MRFTRGDARDHIDLRHHHEPSQRGRSPTIDFREIFGAVGFPTFQQYRHQPDMLGRSDDVR
jgi:hypothetical protein